jgi:glucosamine kinase
MAEELFIGVDGGGTRSRARLRDASGKLLGEGFGGGGNARLREAAFREVMAACRQAVAAAGLGETDLKRIHAGFGLAGTQQDEDRDSVLAWPHPFASISVDTDAYASWLGAFGGRDGAILILGTGAAGLAIVKGKRLNVGGWGADIADEGSGMMIGRTAIRRSLWALEGMAPLTPLADEILHEFDRSAQKAVIWAGTANPSDYARFAPRVFDHADRRDALAVPILLEAAGDASRLINRLLDLGAPQIAMIGGVFPRLLPWLPPVLRPYLVEPAADAADGAILMAQRALKGIGTDRPKT